MSNTFQITVTAVDKATAVVNRINERFGKAVRPVQRMGRSLGALGKEMHLPALAKGFGTAANSAAKLAKNIGISSASMEGLLGIGAAGAAGGVVAGIAAIGAGLTVLGSKVANAGFRVSQLSTVTGISTDALQRYAGAVKLMGGSGDDMQEAMANIGRSMRNAYYEGGPLLQFFNAAGIELRRTKDGAWDVEYALKKLADYSARTDLTPQAKEIAANMVGYVKVLPQMMKGADALEENAKQADKLGAVLSPQAIKNAEAYAKALNKLKASADGLGNTIGSKVYPVLEKIIRGIDDLANADSSSSFLDTLERKTANMPTSSLFALSAVMPGGTALLPGLLALKAAGSKSKTAVPAAPSTTGAATGAAPAGAKAARVQLASPTAGAAAPFIPPPHTSVVMGRLPPAIPVPPGLLSGALPRPALPTDRDGLATVSDNIAKFAPPKPPAKGDSVEDYLAAANKQLALPPIAPPSNPPGQGGDTAQAGQTALNHTLHVKFENAPRGMVVSNASSGGQPASVKVTRSMADIDS